MSARAKQLLYTLRLLDLEVDNSWDESIDAEADHPMFGATHGAEWYVQFLVFLAVTPWELSEANILAAGESYPLGGRHWHFTVCSNKALLSSLQPSTSDTSVRRGVLIQDVLDATKLLCDLNTRISALVADDQPGLELALERILSPL